VMKSRSILCASCLKELELKAVTLGMPSEPEVTLEALALSG
jgi:hypothetical protein